MKQNVNRFYKPVLKNKLNISKQCWSRLSVAYLWHGNICLDCFLYRYYLGLNIKFTNESPTSKYCKQITFICIDSGCINTCIKYFLIK